jgi:hypothetical protein
MGQLGFFDADNRLTALSAKGDPLEAIDRLVPWESFRGDIEAAVLTLETERKSTAGRKPIDAIVLFRMLILQSLYNLSDEQVEYQVRDRLSFTRFLTSGIEDCIPDGSTLWLFREKLAKAGVIEKLFDRFDQHLGAKGYIARGGERQDFVKVAQRLVGIDDLHARRCLANTASTCSSVANRPSRAALSPRSIPTKLLGCRVIYAALEACVDFKCYLGKLFLGFLRPGLHPPHRIFQCFRCHIVSIPLWPIGNTGKIFCRVQSDVRDWRRQLTLALQPRARFLHEPADDVDGAPPRVGGDVGVALRHAWA